jgi:hypothetical protein
MPNASLARDVSEANAQDVLINLEDGWNDDVDREVLLDEVVIQVERLLNVCIVVVSVQWRGSVVTSSGLVKFVLGADLTDSPYSFQINFS